MKNRNAAAFLVTLLALLIGASISKAQAPYASEFLRSSDATVVNCNEVGEEVIEYLTDYWTSEDPYVRLDHECFLGDSYDARRDIDTTADINGFDAINPWTQLNEVMYARLYEDVYYDASTDTLHYYVIQIMLDTGVDPAYGYILILEDINDYDD